MTKKPAPNLNLSIGGLRHFCDSLENDYHPREAESIPRDGRPNMLPETFVAALISYVRACCDHIEATDPNYKDPLAELLTKQSSAGDSR